MLNISTVTSWWAGTQFSFEVNLRSLGSEQEKHPSCEQCGESLPDKIVLKSLTAILACFNFLQVHLLVFPNFISLNIFIYW